VSVGCGGKCADTGGCTAHVHGNPWEPTRRCCRGGAADGFCFQHEWLFELILFRGGDLLEASRSGDYKAYSALYDNEIRFVGRMSLQSTSCEDLVAEARRRGMVVSLDDKVLT
jgi:hypothetical protein